MVDYAEILRLVFAAERAPGDVVPAGLSAGDVAEFQRRSGLDVPLELVQWLQTCNGPCVGPGGLFGLRTARESLDIEGILARHPAWSARNRIPVAGDGSGNYYVLARVMARWPVLFIDVSSDENVPAFVVASTLPLFLRALLLKEQGRLDGWPFSREVTVRADPDIAVFRGELVLPWDAP